MTTTIIGQGITVEGEISSEDEVIVQGTVRGKLLCHNSVVVDETATVEANVSGASVLVSGSVTGDVTASDRVDLQLGAKLVGDVKTARITIAEGASFKGNVDMDMG